MSHVLAPLARYHSRMRYRKCPITFTIVTAFFLSACVAPRPYTPRPPAPEPQPPAPQSGVQTQPALPPVAPPPGQPLPPTPTPRPRTLSPASKALVTQAQSQANAGNDALAAATLERALRIESDNPLIWIELAKIRQNEGNAAQAENLARKALTMAAGDNKAQAAAWRIIAESLRARGRNPEARDAETKAAALGNG